MRRDCSGCESIAIVVFAVALTASGYQSSPANRPWPPGVQKVPDESPALSPAEALKTFYMPPGYHLELVASEPLVQNPIAIDWDADGRLWVVEYARIRPQICRRPSPISIRSAASSCSRTPTTTARWTSERCLPTVSCRRAR